MLFKKISLNVFLFSFAAVLSHRKHGGLKEENIIILWFYRLKVQDASHWARIKIDRAAFIFGGPLREFSSSHFPAAGRYLN